MNRRGFLIGLMAMGTVVATCAKPPGAEAAPLSPKGLDHLDETAKAMDAAAGESGGTATEAHYTGWPHRHVRYRRYYRPRFYRRRYYRPRYYYRPRRHYYYRRRWGW